MLSIIMDCFSWIFCDHRFLGGRKQHFSFSLLHTYLIGQSFPALQRGPCTLSCEQLMLVLAWIMAGIMCPAFEHCMTFLILFSFWIYNYLSEMRLQHVTARGLPLHHGLQGNISTLVSYSVWLVVTHPS